MNELRTLEAVKQLKIAEDRVLYSANDAEIIAGATTDIYFVRTLEILRAAGKYETEVTAEIFASRAGVLCGVDEAINLLRLANVEVWSLKEGEEFAQKDVIMRIKGRYSDFGVYETAILGILASSCGWATAARKIKKLAGDRPVLCFGARHVHPAVASVMERAAIVGGADGCSCILGAKLAGREPSGTVPHAVMLVVGDTLEVAQLYHQTMPPEDPRIMLVDTFKDEAEEALRLANSLKENLQGIRLDTPGERGGVTPGLVRELRARLDQAGFKHVKLFASGGIDEERLPPLLEAGVDSFGIGSYISRASAIDMTMDIKEVEGKAIAKRGRIPGVTNAPSLEKVL
ncbi:MAG TPA: nicotinate phosphoribosyltransferase [Oscillospiraceae bacterium]|nr:nicotinate phosphoribosyltransferase [Oscillospiraceae bacterium]